jgi:UDP-N-acetylmuramate: L-alanyl-gamma-D-glutamyl-meso-diaminopimelate ligase
LAPAFDQSKISSEDRLDQQELLQDIKATGTWVYQARSIDDIIDSLKTRARRGDVIVLMSNGGFGGIYQKLLDQLNATRG